MGMRLAMMAVLCGLACAGLANAAVPRSAENAYRAGAYERAVTLCEAEGSAASLAFAAQALIADAITRPGGFCEPCLRRAIAKADQAIQRDPQRVDGYLQKSIAIGFRGRAIGVSKARAEGLADEAQELLERAVAMAPANAWAQASLGAWHLEIVQHAGPVLADLMYGASRDKGLQHFRTALSLDPHSALLQMNFALALLAMEREDKVTEATRALEVAVADDSQDHLVSYTRHQARQLLQALKDRDPATVSRLVRQFQGWQPQ
jgi:tetratricopeptide (TPR) repeat protein